MGKAISSAAVALVVAWACAGGVLWQAARIVHYHAARWGGKEKRATDTVRLTSASTVIWIEEDELRIDGKMFDVREWKRVGKDSFLIGHFDSADDEIFELLNALFGLGSQPSEGAKRCAVFLPEATMVQLVHCQSLQATPPQPLHNPTPAETWHNAIQSTLEHPPESGAHALFRNAAFAVTVV